MSTGYTPLYGVEKESSETFKVAVTSKSGKLVDQHFGQTTDFMIFEVNGDDYKFLETRSTKKYCNGVGFNEFNNQHHVKTETLKTISDCDAVLSMKIGMGAQKKLEECGIYCVEYCYTVERGLKYLQIIRRKQKKQKKSNIRPVANTRPVTLSSEVNRLLLPFEKLYKSNNLGKCRLRN